MSPLRLNLASEQRQVMTFALHQALKILQMPQLELAEWILGEIERNPLLEQENKCSPSSSVDPLIPSKLSLRDHLLAQARESFTNAADLKIAKTLIDHLDEKGWLTLPLEEFEFDRESLLRILATLQTFDPPGIAARNLQEALLLQLKSQHYSLAEILVREHFQDLLHSRFNAIQKKLRITSSDLQQALHRISRLHMRPAASFDDPPSRPLVPDLSVKQIEQGWILEVGDEDLPLFTIRDDYVDLYPTLAKSEEKETLRGWVTSAKWLKRCLKRRRETLRVIGRLLIRKQAGYFSQEGEINPIEIRDLAQILRVHESTAWRAVAGKTLACPRGLVPLRHFFSESATADSAREILRHLIGQEDKSQPFTDEELSLKLQAKGIECARRTIAKYRRLLKIGPAAQRKALGH